jgi:hypothetical protein
MTFLDCFHMHVGNMLSKLPRSPWGDLWNKGDLSHEKGLYTHSLTLQFECRWHQWLCPGWHRTSAMMPLDARDNHGTKCCREALLFAPLVESGGKTTKGHSPIRMKVERGIALPGKLTDLAVAPTIPSWRAPYIDSYLTIPIDTNTPHASIYDISM